MARLQMEVREAVPGDARSLIDLWSVCVAEGAALADPTQVVAAWEEPSEDEARQALTLVGDSTSRRLCVAVFGDRVVGAIHVDLSPATPLHLRTVVVVSELHVDPRFRRKGVACALMNVAVDWAEQVDSSLVYAWAPSDSRDAHRFLTRLGFGHYATVRAAKVRVLRARAVGRTGASRGTGRLIAVRRSLRRTRGELAAVPAGD
ncbi:GNAT family N-acetyltransferase [Mumia sp. zg.B53]|uniref:GNAT family N-acetyltransferase n=1 Tax=unclassified Mumia TaxID=2621872 RepID=UPI001C6F31B5|nr:MULTISPECIES: GNAT family N-acetyltransferase [unclassified Mumia]MBW9206186.1 GNAT family N-acetyltransferase [Mumia sp. zg.B17]MBW9211520.1 GNAT family N-acetyltransferase [Mumia sp. zg.B21]MBW9216692.1 GNAT family N-acetyltransferase [Mumia sp. zg.B53]MDD9349373.1 GNAT family N-acetyltransferase [Mumia sp.]